MSPIIGCSAATGIAVAALLLSHARGFRPGVLVAKPLASTGFVAAALLAGALETSHGRALLAALALSWIGDQFLLGRRTPLFLAGIAAFLGAHAAYAVAFVVRGVDPVWAGAAGAILALPGGAVVWWLRPRLRGPLRPAVPVYALALTSMFALAVGAFGRGAPWILLLGAGAFYLSDLAVARERFVASSLYNRLWGEPLYFGAQLLLAASVAG